MGTQTTTDAEAEFSAIQFEKRLTHLKDSQESINLCCQWCLNNRQHHKKIVNSWLNVFKRVKVEHRLTLFYLANDVIQYSKRRKYDYVESWGTALQKATTMVRDERVKQKILRIFKIWEERGVYNEEFISDLSGLISVTPSAPKNDEPHEFQSTFVINKIRLCSTLESDTDQKLKKLKEQNPICLDTEEFKKLLKMTDRSHLDDTEKEVEFFATHMDDYINALKTEIKNRIALISILKQSEAQLETDRKDVKIVANAYKSFGQRVKTFHKKLDEHMSTLASPVPSPDINAPSPSSGSDIDLPEVVETVVVPVPALNNKTTPSINILSDFNIQLTTANFYNPVPPPAATENSSFVANGFTSFLGSNLPFDMQTFNPTSMFSNSTIPNSVTETTNSSYGSLSSVIPGLGGPPPPLPPPNNDLVYQPDSRPLLPPPMPPFGNKDETNYAPNNQVYRSGFDSNNAGTFRSPTDYSATFNDSANSVFSTSSSFEVPAGANPYPPSEEYNPEQDLETWDGDPSWTQPMPPLDSETPESPPPFEKESYSGEPPIEYHDEMEMVGSGMTDVDHRVLPSSGGNTDDVLGRVQDVDHRNLISLIGSPAPDSNSNHALSNDQWVSNDQDYRNFSNPSDNGDQDYRLPIDLEQLKLPPPPPPPPKTPTSDRHNQPIQSVTPFGYQDTVESIDMELSDEEFGANKGRKIMNFDHNLGVALAPPLPPPELVDPMQGMMQETSNLMDISGLVESCTMEPPPPLPELLDDVDDNIFLEKFGNEFNQYLCQDNFRDIIPENNWQNNNIMHQHQQMQPDLPLRMPDMHPNMNQLPPPIMTSHPPIDNWMPSDMAPPPFQGQNNFQFRNNNRGNHNQRRGNFNNRDNNGPPSNFRGRGRGGNNNFNNFRGGNNFNNSNFRGGRRGRNRRRDGNFGPNNRGGY